MGLGKNITVLELKMNDYIKTFKIFLVTVSSYAT